MMTPNAEFSASSMPVKTSTFFFKIFSTLATNNLESVASLIAAVPIILNFFTYKFSKFEINQSINIYTFNIIHDYTVWSPT